MRLDDPQATILNQPGDPVGPGLLAILCGDAARFSIFWADLLPVANALPPGSRLSIYMGSDIAGSRNNAIADLLDVNADDARWIFFLDDDHAFRPDILQRLLARNVPIVAPICLRRQQPFLAVPTSLDGDFFRFDDHGPTDLVEVMFAGTSGMLIRRNVLEAIEPPWFEQKPGVSEDVTFCQKAAAAGFPINVDLAARLGHATVAVVWPDWDDEREAWGTGFTIADGAKLKTGVFDPPTVEEDAGAAAVSAQ